MTDFTPPFLVFEGHDLTVYESLDLMISGLEGIDVEDGAYEAFDSVGRVVHLQASGVRRGRFWVDIGQANVDLTRPPEVDERRLHEILVAHLQAVGEAVDSDANLTELVADSVGRQRHGR